MATGEDIALRIVGYDEVSGTMKGITKSVQGMESSGTSAIRNFANSFSMIDAAITGTIGTLGGKSLNELIIGTSSTAETNKILLKNMMDVESAAGDMYNTIDEVTNNSLISMQQLIPVMKSFKSATGATDAEMEKVTDQIANFGASVLATTGSAELAQTAMEKLSYGIKGSYAALDQYGITEDALMRTGLWSGKEDDIVGYMAAVTELTGSTEELMNTNTGLDAQISKMFSKAGKRYW